MKNAAIKGAGAGIVLFGLVLTGYLFNEVSSGVIESPDKPPKITRHAGVDTPPPPPKPIEYSFGGRTLLPNYRIVALYGSPVHSSLGALGEQNLDESIKRAQEVAASYHEFSEQPLLPAFEIIASIAAAEPTPNNDYSRETSPEKLQPWIDAAVSNNMYVIIDLQPGRTSFAKQVAEYESLLIQPNVGLALDPEWRLQKESDRHLASIGSVSAAEINETAKWLADLTAKHRLPQKLFVVHQFKSSMITGREDLDTSRPELAYMIHMDGHGALNSKSGSYSKVQENLPDGIFLGWKNFYDEDKPTPTPKQTMQQSPKPWLVTYQ